MLHVHIVSTPRQSGKSWAEELYNSSINKPKEKQLKYQFHLSSYEQQFDIERVAEDISYNNPIAIIDIDRETGGKDLIVLLSNELLEKAHVCGILEIIEEVIYGDLNFCMVKDVTKKDIQSIINWCTKVKLAPWPKEHRNKATINVSFPKV